MAKPKSITTGEVQQMAKIIHSMNLSYLYEVEPSLILCPKIIGDSTDLLWIKEKMLFASRVFEREFDFQMYLFSEFDTLRKNGNTDLFFCFKQLFPDTCEFYEKGLSKEIIREILVGKFLLNTLCEINLREVKSVYEIMKELISFKQSMGLTNPSVPIYEIQKRTALSIEDLKNELNRLVKLKKIRFEKINEGFLFYLNQ